MTTAIVTLAVCVIYPWVAGRVMRHHGNPQPCRGKNKCHRGVSQCDGWMDTYGPCGDCRAHRRAALSAWFWPAALLLYVPVWMYRRAADLEVVQTPPDLPPAERDAMEEIERLLSEPPDAP